jgi:hypothetical protein
MAHHACLQVYSTFDILLLIGVGNLEIYMRKIYCYFKHSFVIAYIAKLGVDLREYSSFLDWHRCKFKRLLRLLRCKERVTLDYVL